MKKWAAGFVAEFNGWVGEVGERRKRLRDAATLSMEYLVRL